jgi:hypothetical protein
LPRRLAAVFFEQAGYVRDDFGVLLDHLRAALHAL